jgi:hypothetical protein
MNHEKYVIENVGKLNGKINNGLEYWFAFAIQLGQSLPTTE